MLEYSINSKEKVIDGYEISYSVTKYVTIDNTIKTATVNKFYKATETINDECFLDNQKLIEWLKPKIDQEEIKNILDAMENSLKTQDPINIENNN